MSIKKISLFLVIILLLIFSIFYLKLHKKNTKNFIVVNGKKKPLYQKLNDSIQHQINNIPQAEIAKQNKNDMKTNFDTLNTVQKINKFNKK